MSHRAELIAAIAADPESDGPRLVCADWFESQGDPASVARADLIRTSVARARLPGDDPRHGELEARELALLKRFGLSLSGGHHFFRKGTYRRGFIERVHCHLTHFLHHRRQMFALEPVREVSLTGFYRAPEDLVARVARCAEWSRVEALRLHHQGPHHAPRPTLLVLLRSPHLSRLRALRCLILQINERQRRTFEELPLLGRLEHLDLPDIDTFTDDEPWGAQELWLPGGSRSAERWTNLRSLSLGGYARPETLERLAAAPFFRGLSSLAISGIDAPGVAILRRALPDTLEHLDLSYARSETSPLFERLSALPLRSLAIRAPDEPDAIGALLGEGSALRSLTLHEGPNMPAQAKILAERRGLAGLRSLAMPYHRSGSRPLQRLLASGGLRGLFSLDLGGSNIGAKGARALQEAGLEGLTRLDLSGSEADSSTLARLLAGLPRLVWLNLEGDLGKARRLDDTLIAMPCLSALRVSGLSEAATARIAAERPDVWLREERYADRRVYHESHRGELLPPVDWPLRWER